MAKVVWSREALRDIAAIRSYIGQFNPLAAQRLAVRLKSAGNGLRDFPLRTRSLGLSRRELTIVPPYLIRFMVEGDVVTILAIRHGARAEN